MHSSFYPLCIREPALSQSFMAL